MSQAELDKRTRVAREPAAIHSLYARFYGPLTVLMVVLTLLPYHAPKPGGTSTYGNIWQEVAENGNGIDILSLLVFLCLIVLMIFATIGKLPPIGLVATAACALIIAMVLWTSPGYNEKPPFTQAGVVDIVLGFITGALTLAHAIQMIIINRSTGV